MRVLTVLQTENVDSLSQLVKGGHMTVNSDGAEAR